MSSRLAMGLPDRVQLFTRPALSGERDEIAVPKSFFLNGSAHERTFSVRFLISDGEVSEVRTRRVNSCTRSVRPIARRLDIGPQLE